MSEYNHPECHESFLQQPSKVDDLMQFVTALATVDKSEDLKAKNKRPEPVDYSAKVTHKNCLILSRNANATRMTKRSRIRLKVNSNKVVFMRQIDQSLEERNAARKERVMVANRFRRLGNWEYRRGNYVEAIKMYTTGLSYIKDTYVLYLNRAACYYRLRQFKRSIIDCDYIIHQLDPKNLRAWLYRAMALKREGLEAKYEYSVHQARRFNSFKSEFIDAFLEKMRASS